MMKSNAVRFIFFAIKWDLMNKREIDRSDSSGMSRKAWIWVAVCAAILPLIFLEDGPIRILLKDLRVHAIFQLMHILTWIGRGWILMVEAAVLFGIGWWWRNTKLKQAGALNLIALAISGLTVQSIKHLAGRPRPKLTDQGVLDWGPSVQSGHDSFPSGHTISAFAMAAVLSSIYPAGRWIWYSLAVLVAFTRVYIDAHFASDVFVGAVLGVLIGIWVSTLKLGYLKS
jgi:membrane-associated phospholipid phosphatase